MLMVSPVTYVSAAIIIAMGMLADNAIVVFDSALMNMERGMQETNAIMKAISDTAIPCLPLR